MSRFLIRARLKRDVSVQALAPLLLPAQPDERVLAAHRLAWSLMSTDAGATRDFLWREEAPGRLMLLAPRPPLASALFDVESTEFEPNLAPGDRLHFVLRANATVARRISGARGVRDDVVMHALHDTPVQERAGRRQGVIEDAGQAWLRRQGDQHGFVPLEGHVAVDGYDTKRIPRNGVADLRFASLDFSGLLRVENPTVFVSALEAGLGRARAFGCGLMLIRRAALQ